MGDGGVIIQSSHKIHWVMQNSIGQRSDLSEEADVVLCESHAPEHKVLKTENEADTQQQCEIEKCHRNTKARHKTGFHGFWLDLQHEEIKEDFSKHDQDQHVADFKRLAGMGAVVLTRTVFTASGSHLPVVKTAKINITEHSASCLKRKKINF